MPKKNPPCEDCGEYPVNHQNDWLMALFDSATIPLVVILEKATAKIRPWMMKRLPQQAALPLFRRMEKMRLGTLHSDRDEFDPRRNRWLWDSAKKRGITMYQFRLLDRPDGMNFFVATLGSKTIAFEGLPRPDRGVSASLAWMDNKAILKKKFLTAGIPMAQGRACVTYGQALRTMEKVGVPVITKPHIGSRSRHSTIGIRTREELVVGFRKAKQLSPFVIVEQELKGYLFRVLLVRGKIAGIIRREQAHVVGDGMATISELIERENKNPKRHGETFRVLPKEKDILEYLAQQNLNLNSIPAQGEIINLNPHISRWYGGSATDFTERTHPENITLFEYIAKILGDSLVGVDFIIRDMEKSWRAQDHCGVIECNSLPNIDLHHEVLYGESRDIAGLLLDIAFEK